jgi:hypothetical protein
VHLGYGRVVVEEVAPLGEQGRDGDRRELGVKWARVVKG